jgi:putative membrane protein
MAVRFIKPRRPPSLCKGLLVGAIGGLAGGLTKAAAEAIYPPRVYGQTSPPVLLVERLLGEPLTRRRQKTAELCVHSAFSAGIGAVYGAIAEYQPGVTAFGGVAFALALLGLTHESSLPALDLTEPPQRQEVQEHTSELVTHLIFGLTVEQLRRRIRPLL